MSEPTAQPSPSPNPVPAAAVAPVLPAPAPAPSPAVPAAPPAPAFDPAKIAQEAAERATKEIHAKLAVALGVAPETQVDPVAVLRNAEALAAAANIKSLAVTSGVRDPNRFAAAMRGNPAFAVDPTSGEFKNAAAAQAAVDAELNAAPWWKPSTPTAHGAPSAQPVVVAPVNQLPAVPPPPAAPTGQPEPVRVEGRKSVVNLMTSLFNPPPRAASASKG